MQAAQIPHPLRDLSLVVYHGFLKVAEFAWKYAEYGRLASKMSNLFVVRYKLSNLSTDFENAIGCV